MRRSCSFFQFSVLRQVHSIMRCWPAGLTFAFSKIFTTLGKDTWITPCLKHSHMQRLTRDHSGLLIMSTGQRVDLLWADADWKHFPKTNISESCICNKTHRITRVSRLPSITSVTNGALQQKTQRLKVNLLSAISQWLVHVLQVRKQPS